MNSVTSEVESIKLDLAEAACGGWIPFDRMDNYNVTDYIATTSGVPGHNGNPLGDVTAGLATRDGDFVFPEEVVGISTACRPGDPPFLEEHPCQRPAGEPVFGDGANENTDPLDNGVKWTCNALAYDLNRRWKKELWTTTCPGPPETVSVQGSSCYDIDKEDKPEAPPAPDGCTTAAETVYCCTISATAPNAVVCQNNECRGEQRTVSGFTSLNAPYISYYRQYQGSCQRSPFPEPYVENDTTYERRDIPVSCYGFYDEYDPYERASEPKDFSCVIANTYPDSGHDFLEAPVSQVSNMSAVEYGQNMANEWLDPPEGYTLNRTADTDLWLPKNGGFALTDKDTLERDYKNDLSYALLSVDNASMKAYPQFTADQPISSGALLRAFDETKQPEANGRRYFTEWWQEVETEMDQILTPPRVRLILPHAQTVGLDRNHPFITKNLETIRPISNRRESVEILLQAKDDLLGELADYLTDSPIIQIQEEEVPIVVPMASPVELRALADSWCTWYMESSGNTNCDNAPAEVQNVRNTLDGYADYIDKVRNLRSELYRYESALLERQNDAIRILHQWLNDVISTYQAYLDSLGDISNLRMQWKQTSDMYTEFYDRANQPWCMNERFTTPIYSNLDQWYPGRPDVTGGIDDVITTTDASALPRLDVYLPQTDPSSPYDVYIDLSNFSIANEPLVLPVLKPIQVRLDWGAYAPPEKNGPVPTNLPPLPSMPTIYQRIENSWPSIVQGTTPPIITSYFPIVEDTIDELFIPRVQRMIQEMTNRYDSFWISLLQNPNLVKDGTEEDCISPDTVPCSHVEMDLKERFQRMCARPAVLMKEDFDVIGSQWISPELNDYDFCPREDWSCQLLWRSETYGKKGWAVIHPEADVRRIIIEGLRRDMFYDTLLRPGLPEDDKIKFMVTPEEILPSFNIPARIELTPESE